MLVEGVPSHGRGCVGGWLVVGGVEPCGSDWPGAGALMAVAVDAEGLRVVEV